MSSFATLDFIGGFLQDIILPHHHCSLMVWISSVWSRGCCWPPCHPATAPAHPSERTWLLWSMGGLSPRLLICSCLFYSWLVPEYLTVPRTVSLVICKLNLKRLIQEDSGQIILAIFGATQSREKLVILLVPVAGN